MTTSSTNALMRAEVRYSASWHVGARGVGESTETTVWRDVGEDPGAVKEFMGEATRRAASAYVPWMQRFSRGLIGDIPERGSAQGPSFFLRPLRFEIMAFSPLRDGPGDGEVSLCVQAGFLAPKVDADAHDGRLIFSWWREGADEIFQTKVRGYRSRLAGRGGPIGRALYAVSQMQAHRFVMWRFHVWVRSQRNELLPFAHLG